MELWKENSRLPGLLNQNKYNPRAKTIREFGNEKNFTFRLKFEFQFNLNYSGI